MPAFTGEQWPGSSLPPSRKWTAVRAIAIAIMVVAAPARTVRRLDLEHSVYDPQGVFDQRVAWAANTVANQFEEPRVDDVLGRKLPA